MGSIKMGRSGSKYVDLKHSGNSQIIIALTYRINALSTLITEISTFIADIYMHIYIHSHKEGNHGQFLKFLFETLFYSNFWFAQIAITLLVL